MNTAVKTATHPTSEAIGIRLRGFMGIHKVSRAKLSLACGINRTSLGKKLDGIVPFEIDDIASIATALGQSWEWVAMGIGESRPMSDSGPSVGRAGLEPATSGLVVRPFVLIDNVVCLAARRALRTTALPAALVALSAVM